MDDSGKLDTHLDQHYQEEEEGRMVVLAVELVGWVVPIHYYHPAAAHHYDYD